MMIANRGWFVAITILFASPVLAAEPDFSKVPGTVITHAPAHKKQYLGSPSIAVLPNGEYVFTHDFFGPGSTRDTTAVFASPDKGKTWKKRAEIVGQWWSTLFVHKDALYLMGTSKEYGHCVIRRSTDGGKTWTSPKDKNTGLLHGEGKYHCAPVPVVLHDGRLWRAMEDAEGPGGWGSHFRSFMMSAPVDADLLRADSWTSSNRLARDPKWLDNHFGGWLEGNAVVTPEGKLVNILRADYREKDGEKVAIVSVSKDGKEQTFDPKTGFLAFPGGSKKFTIRHDPRGKHYWTLTNWVPDKHRDANPQKARNTLALARSADLKKWDVRAVLLYHPDNVKSGFQYADWVFDGDDLIAVVRTAYDDGLGGAHNQHDANFMTFHRIENFRDRTGTDLTTTGVGFNDMPEMTKPARDAKPLEYVEANVPFYPPGRRGGGSGEPLKKMQKPLPVEESVKHMVHPVGFELKLFAAEPDFGGKPIAMAWDERGRLWVAVTVDYPNDKQPEGKGRDRIVICEDADADGRADKFTVFADKFSIPTSLAFANGGVVVHQAPQTLFLKDTDGDDRADVRKVLFSGWHTNDTHAGPSNLNYGLDNWLYGMVGYAGFDGTVGGERQSFRTGFYRFRPDGSKIEFLRNTNNNSWGVGFSEEGLLFGSTANGCPSVYLPIPNRYYESVRGWSSTVLKSIATENTFHPVTEKVRQVDWHGGFTAAAGHALYTARTYPREYWNRTAFVTDPTGHLAATFVLQPRGTDFTAKYGWNLLASHDEWTSPTMAEVGPDGNVWVIDWYAYIVQHNPTPAGFRTGKGNAYETELRDKKHGRIYRLVYTGAKEAKPFTLAGASPEKLVETLKHDNLIWRKHAQRLLVERGKKDVLPALVKLAADKATDQIGLNVGAIHALWTLHGLGALEGSDVGASGAATAALKHASAGVRRNAAAVMPRTNEGLTALLRSGVLDDADAHVRLAALLAVAEMPPSDAAARAVAANLTKRENVSDIWILDAITTAAAANDLGFLQTIAAAKEPSDGALEVVGIVAQHYARGGPTKTAGSVLVALADGEPRVAEVILAGMSRGWPRGRAAETSEEVDRAIARLLDKVGVSARGQLVNLATAWGSKGLDKYATGLADIMLASASDEKLSEPRRTEAARQVMEFRPADVAVAEKLLDLVTPRTAPALAEGLIEAAGSCTAPETGAALVSRFANWPPSARAAAVRALLTRPAATQALLEAIDKGKIPLGELTLDQKQALAAHPEKKIADLAKTILARGGGLPSADRQKIVEELAPLAKKSGDADKGQAIFKKHCATCHMHSGEGSQVGPDLTGMAVHPREHLLIEILDPSRSVEGNFRVYSVTTRAGKVLTGLLASETRTSIELIDAQAKRQILLREEVDEITASKKSLMPEGFEKQLPQEEIVDLLSFLTRRGKYLPLPLDKVATVVSTKGMFNDEKSTVERLVFADWKPRKFEGVPFNLIDPQGDRVKNVVLLYGPKGTIPPKMPKSVKLECNAPAKTIHLLSGVSGWGHPTLTEETVSMIVRLHYADGKTEDHELKNGRHFADYIRRVDVPDSKFAYRLQGQQIRYLAVTPKRKEAIKQIELVKGPDDTAPVVMAVTVEVSE